MAQPGIRACALVERPGDQAVVAASVGYDCGSMSAGVALPLDAGRPVTEAVRTGRLVVHGVGPSWVAVPFGRPCTRPASGLRLWLTWTWSMRGWRRRASRRPTTTLEDLAERVLAAAEAVGPAGDDVSLLLVRRRQ